MNINNIYKDIATELSVMGVGVAADPGVTVNEIIEISNDLDIDTIEELLNRLTSYNTYLKSQKGSFEAQLVVKSAQLKRALYLKTQQLPKQSESGSYLTKEEKEATVLSTELVELNEKVITLKAMLARVKDIPYAIDNKIDLLKMKYRRLMSDANRKEG